MLEQARNVVERPHPLVGTRIDSNSKDVRYKARYGVQHPATAPIIESAGTMVLPTSAELEAATIAGRMQLGHRL